MIRVILESPHAGTHLLNLKYTDYARRCVAHSLSVKESPLASHLLYTQSGILDDLIYEDRNLGIDAGHAWVSSAQRMVVYIDYGISQGMREGIEQAERFNVPVIERLIGLNPQIKD